VVLHGICQVDVQLWQLVLTLVELVLLHGELVRCLLNRIEVVEADAVHLHVVQGVHVLHGRKVRPAHGAEALAAAVYRTRPGLETMLRIHGWLTLRLAGRYGSGRTTGCGGESALSWL